MPKILLSCSDLDEILSKRSASRIRGWLDSVPSFVGRPFSVLARPRPLAGSDGPKPRQSGAPTHFGTESMAGRGRTLSGDLAHNDVGVSRGLPHRVELRHRRQEDDRGDVAASEAKQHLGHRLARGGLPRGGALDDERLVANSCQWPRLRI